MVYHVFKTNRKVKTATHKLTTFNQKKIIQSNHNYIK